VNEKDQTTICDKIAVILLNK